MLVNWKCEGEVHLVVGDINGIISHRLKTIVDSGATPILITQTPNNLEYEQYNKQFDLKDLHRGRAETMNIVDKVTVNIASDGVKRQIYNECRRLRIPISTIDSAEYCTYSAVTTYKKGGFQVGVTTSGNGCKLGSRIKREIVSKLPPDIDSICQNVGDLRRVILQQDGVFDSDDDDTNLQLNVLVKEFDMNEQDLKMKRINWLNQIVEYYPLEKLRGLKLQDLEDGAGALPAYTRTDTCAAKRAKGKVLQKKGTISLVGAGPGSVSLLTKGAVDEIISAELVLADKLVPQEVLDMVPKKTELFIARKFPGNAERAQQELLELGLEALNKGFKVVRLKQGDPYIFGRGGEEYLFFKEHGFIPLVLPGITSALSAPLLANIPMTHRDVSDQVLICTGTGKKGCLPNIPEFVTTRTTVFLMALHRINEFVDALVEKGWDTELPCAIVERASCPDQRIIKSRLMELPDVVQKYGSRPPGLLVTGYVTNLLNDDILVEGVTNAVPGYTLPA
ncbi:uroporphyrin-III C-methyltransferase [Yamadazyma tenuis]|nr:uroporphyrin-III C-methyltransferase [Yamadazyma tenuis]